MLIFAGLTVAQDFTPTIPKSTGNKIDAVENQSSYEGNDSGKVIAKLVYDVNANMYLHPPTHFLATTGTDTVGGAGTTSWIDTLTSTSSYYQTWSIMPLNDTAQVSVVSGTFTTAQILLPYQVFSITVDPTLNLNFYVRRYGTDGTVTYQIYGGGY